MYVTFFFKRCIKPHLKKFTSYSVASLNVAPHMISDLFQPKSEASLGKLYKMIAIITRLNRDILQVFNFNKFQSN